MNQDFYFIVCGLATQSTTKRYKQSSLTGNISQNDIQTRSQIDNDSINNIFDDDYVILDLDKQMNEESIPLENVAEEEKRREILVET